MSVLVGKDDLNKLDVLAARNSMDGNYPIRIHNFAHRGEIEFVDVTFQGDRKNIQLHYKRYNDDDCPYNQVPQTTPYIVLKNDVYEISTFTTIGYQEVDIT